MRGETEQNCFEIVKASLNNDIYFAMSFEDRKLIKRAFNEAKPNTKESSFPDFIFSDGYIEHFQVTSSLENRKGATMQIEKSKIAREIEQKKEKSIENLPKGEITFHHIESAPFWHKTHSYENYVDSFKKNYQSHIESQKNYLSVENTHSIFMIEYSDDALRMNKKYPQGLMLDVTYGDLLKKECPIYRFSRDSQLLDYIYESRKKVEYVIFINESSFGNYVDVIKTQNALEIKKLLYDGYDFHCAMIGTTEVAVGISIPIEKGKE